MDFIAAGGPAPRRTAMTSSAPGQAAAQPSRISPAGGLSLQALGRGAQGMPAHLLPSITAQMDALGEDDPALVKDYLTLLMILHDDPETLDAFVKHMKEGMRAARTPSAPLPGASAQALTVEIEMSTTHLSAWVAQTTEGGVQTTVGGVTVSRETVRVRISIQAGRFAVQPAAAPGKDPLTLDLNGSGTLDMANRGRFDVDGDGRVDDTPLPSGGDAFVALDVNGNGRIDDGHELFGDQNGAAHGFAELAKYDDNADGTIDAADAVYGRLEVMGDFDADGDMEQQRLSETGVSAIAVDSQADGRRLSSDVELTRTGTYTRNARTGLAGVLLVKYV